MKTIVLEYDGRAFVPQEAVSLPAGYQATLEVEEVEAQFEVYSEEEYGPIAEIFNLANQFPPDADWPADFGAQHDHYLHGASKNPANEPPSQS